MGRQICFYLTETDTIDLINFIHAKGGVLIDFELNKLDSIKTDRVLIVLPDSRLHFRDFKGKEMIDLLTSEVIDFSVSSMIINQTDFPYGYEHGRFWYETSYFDDSGKLIRKSDSLNKFYNLLKRYIVKRYRLSKDKQWYMSPSAYERYLEGHYIPYSGNHTIDFR